MGMEMIRWEWEGINGNKKVISAHLYCVIAWCMRVVYVRSTLTHIR